MPWARHRFPLFTAACLDAAGLIGLALMLSVGLQRGIERMWPQSGSLVVLVVIYCSLGWLFGSYTLLKLQHVTWLQVVARLGSTAMASMTLAALYSYVFRLQITSTLFFRSNLIPLFVLISLWSAIVRLILRRYWPGQQRKRWHVLALPQELALLRHEWDRSNATAGPLPTITCLDANAAPADWVRSEALALSAGVINNRSLQIFCQKAVSRGQAVFSIVEMAEQELQRIPPKLVENQWLLFSGSIDGQRITLHKQIKRYADVVISALILAITSPVLLISAILVKLQDGGKIIYTQERSGLMGQPFRVFKIRTMTSDAEQKGPQWASKNDTRVTPVGYWLRRTRIDELPQLINVLRGEMSLIGPRPERPDLEKMLEAEIPNYRLRHWMRPGLSGWAQVNVHYASSVADSELKLSYDLFYLRNSTIWLDLLILFKTIKIVLKAAGR